MRRLALVIAAIASIASVAAPAWAQARRYRPEPVDRDQEAARYSGLWESATNPRRTPYDKLIGEAEAALRDGTTSSAQEAARKLDEAVKLMPDEPRAYRARGEANLRLKSWARCAEDLAAAWARDPGGAAGEGARPGPARSTRSASPSAGLDERQLTELRRKLGLCQARAGRLGDAERTLAEAAVTGNATGEIWMRLGEVRIAMGKLEEAIAALESAAEHGDVPSVLVRWLLAGAYDRARKPAESIEAVRAAMRTDRTFSLLRSEKYPLLGEGEPEYLQGLAYTAAEQPSPDYALIYFRYFLQVAKESPWRRRAEEHVRELKRSELPEAIERLAGNAPLDLLAARAPVRRAMAAMRACAARTPFIIYKITITKAGPRTPPVAIPRPRYGAPPEGVMVVPVVGLPSTGDVPQADRDGVVRCIEPIASRIGLPAIRDKDLYYRLAFSVVAP